MVIFACCSPQQAQLWRNHGTYPTRKGPISAPTETSWLQQEWNSVMLWLQKNRYPKLTRISCNIQWDKAPLEKLYCSDDYTLLHHLVIQFHSYTFCLRRRISFFVLRETASKLHPEHKWNFLKTFSVLKTYLSILFGLLHF